MSAAKHMIALLRSYLQGDDVEFLSVAMQAAAHEATPRNANVAEQLKDLVDEAKRQRAAVQHRPGQLVVLEPRGELANLLSVQMPATRLSDITLPAALSERLHRILTEQRQQQVLREHGLTPAPEGLVDWASGLGQDADCIGARGRIAPSAVHHSLGGTDHQISRRNRSHAADEGRLPIR